MTRSAKRSARPVVTPRRYGGLVVITPVRNRIETGEDRFSIAYYSTDGNVSWLSRPIGTQDHAAAAAATLAEFLGAEVRS